MFLYKTLITAIITDPIIIPNIYDGKFLTNGHAHVADSGKNWTAPKAVADNAPITLK